MIMTGPLADRDVLCLALGGIASRAGAAIMKIDRDGAAIIDKEDGSPLTEADLAADREIAAGLQSIAPDIKVLSEETAASIDADTLGDRFFVVDPLDGTREFIAGNDDFTVNIAFVEHGIPVAGVVYAPAHCRIWLGGTTARVGDLVPGRRPDPAHLTAMHCIAPPPRTLRAVASRSHRDQATDAYLAGLGECETVAVGSAIKLCMVAEGKADVYPRFGPTMVWDTAAGIAVVKAAGGTILGTHGQPLRVAHGADGWRNGPFVVWGCPTRAAEHPVLT